MLRKGIKFSIQRVYFPQSYFESRHYGKRFNSIGKFKSLTFQLRAIYFHTFAVDMSVEQILEDGVEGLFVALLVDVDVDGLVGVIQAGSFEVTVD